MGYNSYGYYESENLPKDFEKEIMPHLELSKGAIGDMKKSDNIINGYIIDIRRTMWDMMKMKNLNYEDNLKELESVINGNH